MQSEVIMDGRLEVFEDGSICEISERGRKMLNQYTTGRDRKHHMVNIQINKKQVHLYVHTLVAQAFIPNPEGKSLVMHKDGDPENNRADNLRWATPKEIACAVAERRKTECKICGNITSAADNVCTACKCERKKVERRAKTSEQKRRRNEDVFADLDLYTLTEQQRKMVRLRMENLSIGEIGEIMGCSRQNVDSSLKRILAKNLQQPSAGKGRTTDYLKNRTRLDKKTKLLSFYEKEAEVLKREIQFLDQIISAYETTYPELMEGTTVQ